MRFKGLPLLTGTDEHYFILAVFLYESAVTMLSAPLLNMYIRTQSEDPGRSRFLPVVGIMLPCHNSVAFLVSLPYQDEICVKSCAHSRWDLSVL